MGLRAFKFEVSAVLLEERDGCVVGEHRTSPVVLYAACLADAAVEFDRMLAETLKEVE